MSLALSVSNAGATTLCLECFPTVKTKPQYPKSPVCPPVVDLTGYTLTFGHAHGYDVPVELLNEEGEVVHTDCLAAGQTTLSLPLSLTGAYTLRLTVGNYYFIGEIEL